MINNQWPINISIIGQGRAGGALKLSLESAGYEPTFLLKGEQSKRHLDLLFLAVQDEKLPQLAKFVSTWKNPPSIIAHLSAATHLDSIAVFHPLAALDASLPIPSGCTIGVFTEDQNTQTILFGLAEQMHLCPRVIEEANQTLYHAAAVIASNFPVALLTASQEIFKQVGFNETDAHQATLDLFNSMAKNLNRYPTFAGALTGPAKRGDQKTIERHLKALEGGDPKLLELYQKLSNFISSFGTS